MSFFLLCFLSSFSALVRFTYGANSGCGGVINLRTSSVNQGTTMRSLDADSDGHYEPNLNCQWLVAGRQGKNVRLRFTEFDVESAQNETGVFCWDYIEVRDGDGPYSPLIGRYCGNGSPPTVDTTRNFMWIKFFSDSTDNRVGFTASVSNVEPVCGSHEVINVSSTVPQTLVSPNFPRNYPPNVRCQWVLTAADRYQKIHVRFVDLSMEDSPRCGNDFIRLEDEDNRLPVSHGGENGSLVVSTTSSYTFRYRWRRVSMNMSFD